MKKKLITTIFSALLALALFCAAQAAVDRTGAQALALKAAGRGGGGRAPAFR